MVVLATALLVRQIWTFDAFAFDFDCSVFCFQVSYVFLHRSALGLAARQLASRLGQSCKQPLCLSRARSSRVDSRTRSLPRQTLRCWQQGSASVACAPTCATARARRSMKRSRSASPPSTAASPLLRRCWRSQKAADAKIREALAVLEPMAGGLPEGKTWKGACEAEAGPRIQNPEVTKREAP